MVRINDVYSSLEPRVLFKPLIESCFPFDFQPLAPGQTQSVIRLQASCSLSRLSDLLIYCVSSLTPPLPGMATNGVQSHTRSPDYIKAIAQQYELNEKQGDPETTYVTMR